MSRRREGATKDLSGLPISPGIEGGVLHTFRRWQAELVNGLRRRLLLDITSSPNRDDLAYFNDVEKFWQTEGLTSLLERLLKWEDFVLDLSVSSGAGSISSSTTRIARYVPVGPICVFRIDVGIQLSGTVVAMDFNLPPLKATTKGGFTNALCGLGQEALASPKLMLANLVDQESVRIFLTGAANFNTSASNSLSLIGFYEREI